MKASRSFGFLGLGGKNLKERLNPEMWFLWKVFVACHNMDPGAVSGAQTLSGHGCLVLLVLEDSCSLYGYPLGKH
jgi:hypothetical protein